jgi:hypothetical protein
LRGPISAQQTSSRSADSRARIFCDEFVLRDELIVERRLGGGGCLGNRLDADAGNAVPEKQLGCCRENACSRRDFGGPLLSYALAADVAIAAEVLAVSCIELGVPIHCGKLGEGGRIDRQSVWLNCV